MNALPKGWVEERLNEVCDLITDGTHHSPSNGAAGAYKYVTAKNIRKQGLDLTGVTYVDAATHRAIYSRCPVKFKDILYIKDGATTGVAIVNPIYEEFSMLSSVALLRPGGNLLDSHFLCYQLNSRSIKGRMIGDMTGSAIRRLTLTTIGKQVVNVPPLAEQKRIVAKLDALTAKSTRARTELARIETLVARYKQALLGKAFSGELTSVKVNRSDTSPGGAVDLPSHWRRVHVGAIADIKSGITLGKKRKPNETLLHRPYLRVANVQRGWLDLHEIKTIEVTAREAEALYLREGDVLMNEGGDRDKLGRGWVWEDQIPNCIHQNHVFRLRLARGTVPPRFLSYYANEFGQKHFFDEGKQTTNLASISKSKLSAMMVPIPPFDEAEDIVRRIESAFAKIDRLAAEAKRALDLLGKLDEAILAEAFRGELVPQDESDEPAEQLLARIRAERAAAPKTRRGRRTPA